LAAVLRLKQTTRAKKLLQRHADGGHRKILFADEKIFTVEKKFNRQNDRVYARSCQEVTEIIPKVEKGQNPASMMVWRDVAYEGGTKLHFCEQGVYEQLTTSDILEKVVKPLGNTVRFAGFFIAKSSWQN
jgi:hypothetical protein